MIHTPVLSLSFVWKDDHGKFGVRDERVCNVACEQSDPPATSPGSKYDCAGVSIGGGFEYCRCNVGSVHCPRFDDSITQVVTDQPEYTLGILYSGIDRGRSDSSLLALDDVDPDCDAVHALEVRSHDGTGGTYVVFRGYGQQYTLEQAT